MAADPRILAVFQVTEEDAAALGSYEAARAEAYRQAGEFAEHVESFSERMIDEVARDYGLDREGLTLSFDTSPLGISR